MAKYGNCFDGMRYFAAFSVFFGHHFTLFGVDRPLLLGVLGFESLGVYIFFILSGFLIAQSWARDPHVGRFLLRRALRIVPAFWVVVVLTVIWGSVVSDLNALVFIADAQTWAYFKTLYFDIQPHLPGVFEQNPYPDLVNGSLWTLPWEVACYLGFAVFAVMTWWRSRAFAVLVLLTVSLAMLLKNPDTLPLQVLASWFTVFAFVWGVLWFAIWDSVREHLFLTGLVLVIMALPLTYFGWIYSAAFVLLPFALLWFCQANFLNRANFGRAQAADYSYGIYLFHVPVQQSLISYFSQTWAEIWIFLVAVLLTGVCAVASWHLVEKRALSLKPKHQRKHHA